ncbi:threonine synthase [Natrialbaceae archaeon A-gly3]
MPSDLYCPTCGAEYEAGPDEPWRCSCGHPLELEARPLPDGDPLPLSRLDTTRGLWTFFEFLPVERRVTLGEGFTPLLEVDEWNAAFKLEYVLPTGSFKDRGATTALSRALELGVETVLEDSSGNAGASIATYAARAGLEAEVYVPADVRQSKLMAIQRAGARPIRIEGSREDVTVECVEDVDAGKGWYASHVWNPAFHAGVMTFAFEIAAQCGWTAPDAVVVPVGHGTLALGTYRGFSRLNEAGIVDGMPRLLCAQAAGYAPIVEELGGETVGEGENELADGVQIHEPPRGGQIADAIEDTGGDAVALGPDPVEIELDRLHRNGFYVEPTCGLAPAALRWYREQGILDEDDDVVVPLTGSGMKTL